MAHPNNDTVPGFSMQSEHFLLKFVTGMQLGVSSNLLEYETDWYEVMEILLSRLEDEPEDVERLENIASRDLEYWARVQPGGDTLDLKIRVTLEEKRYFLPPQGTRKTLKLTFNDRFSTVVLFHVRKKVLISSLKFLSSIVVSERLLKESDAEMLDLPNTLVPEVRRGWRNGWTARFYRTKVMVCPPWCACKIWRHPLLPPLLAPVGTPRRPRSNSRVARGEGGRSQSNKRTQSTKKISKPSKKVSKPTKKISKPSKKIGKLAKVSQPAKKISQSIKKSQSTKKASTKKISQSIKKSQPDKKSSQLVDKRLKSVNNKLQSTNKSIPSNKRSNLSKNGSTSSKESVKKNKSSVSKKTQSGSKPKAVAKSTKTLNSKKVIVNKSSITKNKCANNKSRNKSFVNRKSRVPKTTNKGNIKPKVKNTRVENTNLKIKKTLTKKVNKTKEARKLKGKASLLKESVCVNKKSVKQISRSSKQGESKSSPKRGRKSSIKDKTLQTKRKSVLGDRRKSIQSSNVKQSNKFKEVKKVEQISYSKSNLAKLKLKMSQMVDKLKSIKVNISKSSLLKGTSNKTSTEPPRKRRRQG